MPQSRRDFLRSAMAGGAALVLPRFTPLAGILGRRAAGRSRLADSHIDIRLDDPIGTIAPEIYGHFTEHLGGVIYDGVWVGENSKIPNVGGIRKALVDALRLIRPSVIRWPGGCFADSYDWRDGVGPRDKRPTRTNFWADDAGLRGVQGGPAKYDPNAFGTSEFMRFCRLVGAQPYLAANVRSLPARAFDEWIEYCNAPAGDTTWSDVRAAAGDAAPYGVRYWGVGNEAWGCGGNFTPEEYAEEFRRFTTAGAPDYGVGLRFVASGPSGADRAWTRGLFDALRARYAVNSVWGLSVHHYCSAPDAGAHAVNFDERGWYDLLASANRMESVIDTVWTVAAEGDPRHHVKLVVDEWGAWHASHPIADASHLFESQSTIRDAVVAGLTLDTFNRNCDKVAMANVAQMINCIQSVFLAHDDGFTVTPVYHVFAMYAAHQGARAVRAEFSAPPHSWTDKDNGAATLWGLNGSASVRGNTLTLTVTNPSMTEARETEIAVRGGAVRSVRATTLAAHSVHDVNTFAHPDTVAPTSAELPAGAVGGSLVYEFPPASVTKLEFALG
ncbi:MAG: alpha-L-arabinofuranosidase [Gemmatimonadota bacterium]|nr:alpha-L-arabinofuranosidase [Gemmatimonadota bacterium]